MGSLGFGAAMLRRRPSKPSPTQGAEGRRMNRYLGAASATGLF